MKINNLDVKDIKQRMLAIQKQADKYAKEGVADEFGDSPSDFWTHFRLIKSNCGIWFWVYNIKTLEEVYSAEITPFQCIQYEDDDFTDGYIHDFTDTDDIDESDKIFINDDYTTTNHINDITKAQNLLNEKMKPILEKLNN